METQPGRSALADHHPIAEEELIVDPVADPETDLPGDGAGSGGRRPAAAPPAAPRRPRPPSAEDRAAVEEWLTEALIEEVRLCEVHHAAIAERRRVQRRELPFGVDPHDLRQAGWGVVVPESSPPGVREALGPLLDHRRRLAGDRFRELRYRRDDTARRFLEHRHGAAPGVVDPRRVPYYLLLAGGPEEIPFDVQCQLNVHHAVGRVFFDDLDAYRRYARSVVDAERHGVELPGRFTLFSVEHPGDVATERLAAHLVDPLAARLAESSPAWQVEVWRRERATKEALARLLGGDATPGLLLAACHGLSMPCGDAEQRRLQGALICQDRPADGSLGPEHCFAAADVADGARLHGLIAVLLACYGAGTPEADSYPAEGSAAGTGRRRLSPSPFLAHLPQELLGRGALAVLGHLDRGWTLSFSWLLEGRVREAAGSFEDLLRRLLAGHRLGHALRPLYRRYTALAAQLVPVMERVLDGEADAGELRLLRVAVNDARNFLPLGDPAVYARGRRNAP